MSESVEMYLITVARLRRADQPVPVALLAQGLGISPISANEMCRRLAERALVAYQPYKGVTLTTEGERLARRVLCRRRLWEVFLVEQLGLTPTDADEIACRLEHVTPDTLTERLAAFLAFPTHSPQGEPIPYDGRPEHLLPTHSLGSLPVGRRARIIEVSGADAPLQAFLRVHGLVPGAVITVLGAAADELLVAVGQRTLVVAHSIEADVRVTLLDSSVPDVLAVGTTA